MKDIHNKTFNPLVATLNCKVEQLSEKEILARIHLPTGPGLGFVDLRNATEPAYCAAWLQAVYRLSQFKMDYSTYPGTLNHMKLTRS